MLGIVAVGAGVFVLAGALVTVGTLAWGADVAVGLSGAVASPAAGVAVIIGGSVGVDVAGSPAPGVTENRAVKVWLGPETVGPMPPPASGDGILQAN